MNLSYAHRTGIADVVVETFGEQRALATMLTLDESLHRQHDLPMVTRYQPCGWPPTDQAGSTVLNSREDAGQMRERKAARLLVISSSRDVLLFQFRHQDGALAGRNYWATPGGGLEDGETFQVAAIRELREETGIQVDTVIGPVAYRRFSMLLPSGETVFAVEQYFVVWAESLTLSRSEWTLHEVQVMADHHWWSADQLRSTGETIWPEGLVEMLVDAGIFEQAV